MFQKNWQELIKPGKLKIEAGHDAGRSATITQFFLSVLPASSAVATAASSVSAPRTTSTSGSTATGLKKWNPTTRSGCAMFAAIAVTDSEEGPVVIGGVVLLVVIGVLLLIRGNGE